MTTIHSFRKGKLNLMYYKVLTWIQVPKMSLYRFFDSVMRESLFSPARFFRIFFDFNIFANAWFIAFDIDEADWFFLVIFLLEIILKLYVFGPVEFFKRLWNV